MGERRTKAVHKIGFLPGRLTLIDDAGVAHAINYRARLQGEDDHAQFVYGLAYRMVNPRMPRYMGCLAPFVIAAIMFFIAVVAATTSWALLAAPILMVVAIVGYDAFRQQRFRNVGSDFIEVFLGNGLCPACLYRLAESPPDEHGLVCCTECAAHWQAARVRNPHVGRGVAERDIAEFAGRRSLWKARPIEDHGGSAQNLLDTDFRRAIALASSDDHRARLMTVRSRLRRIAIPRRVTIGLLWLAVMGYFATRMGMHALSLWPPRSTIELIGLAWGGFWLYIIAMGAVAIVNPHGHGASKKAAVREMLAVELCPACGECLRDTGEPLAGMACCPRCRAKWRLPGTPYAAPRPPLVDLAVPERCPSCNYFIDPATRRPDGFLYCQECGLAVAEGVPSDLPKAVRGENPERCFCVGCARELSNIAPEPVRGCVCESCGHQFVALEAAAPNPWFRIRCPNCTDRAGAVIRILDVVRCPECRTFNQLGQSAPADSVPTPSADAATPAPTATLPIDLPSEPNDVG